MADFTRRKTGFDNPDDYAFRYRGRDVGRCYRSRFGMTVGESWLWTIYSPRSGTGAAERGYEPTLEEAQEAFKSNFRKMFGA